MKRVLLTLLLALAPLDLPAAQSESLPERTLRQIVEKQKQLLEDAEKQGDSLDPEALRTQAQSIVHEYDRLTAQNPRFAAGFAAYGYFLQKVGMDRESLAMLLKANQLDPEIPLVKNQIGNHLAESGKPIDAAKYYLAAIKLEPREPLYHFQLGNLLALGRDAFLKSGEWTRDSLDHSMHGAFKQATELAPDRFEYAYRFAESYYELANPDWNAALEAWMTLEARGETELEKQTMRLHQANVLIKQGKLTEAKLRMDRVTEPALQGQKQRLEPLLRTPDRP